MKTLIADLEECAGRKPYQVCSVRFGIETTEFLVPLNKMAPFEKALNEEKLDKLDDIHALARRFGGLLNEDN